jgi:dTDP-4-amino-4,6-dideoxygalactose transaminase
MQTITQLASKYGLSVVEDAAQAFCSSFRGRRAGSFSVVAAFSMNPMKILHGYGESGVVTTNDHQIFRNLTKLRHAGTRKDPTGVHINRCDNVSLNHKIDTIQAAFLLENLEHLTEVWNRRDRIARLYDRELEGVVGVPKIADGETHGRYLYVIHCRKRNALRKYLAKQEIESKVVYSPLACDAEPYRDVKRLEVPVSRRLLRKTLSIPLHEKMSFAQAKYVAKKIKEFYGVC